MDMFPFFRSPYYYYAQKDYRRQGYNKQNEKRDYIKTQNLNQNEKTNNASRNLDKSIGETEKCEAPIFEIFGIKLYFDDILIIALIFFLYSEGVEDNLLFISLILLLLS